MGKEKKKYTSGAATSFISRSSAVKKLQLTLVDFRRLCILKGIYPVQPKNVKKANKGSKTPKTFFRYKDIQFLAHEPILKKFREHKAFLKKLKKAVAKRENKAAERLTENKPTYRLDHIVKERYPTFADAIKDLHDPLTLCSLFTTLRVSAKISFTEGIRLSRRLLSEFMNFVIASRSLRKVFLSIKGIYYQVEIQGQPITWIVPYQFNYKQPVDVDLKIMSTFVEFYTTLLGFVNFKLYHSLNLHYPPKLTATDRSNKLDNGSSMCQDEDDTDERIASLAHDLVKVDNAIAEDDGIADEDDEELIAASGLDTEAIEKAREEEKQLSNLKKLFEGCKFFLSREVPRESLSFVIRSFGGRVSWDKCLFLGATYDVTDESITHQLIDRPQCDTQYISRYYIQPQWVYDCVNARMLLPAEDYFIGVNLPPHLSPFVEEQEGDYVPPEKRVLLARQKGVLPDEEQEEEEEETDEEEEDEEEIIDESEGEENVEDEGSSDEEEEGESEEETKDEEETLQKKRKMKDLNTSNLSVEAGQVHKVDPSKLAKKQEMEEKRLREMMLPKKRKWLYDRIVQKKKEKSKQARKLTERREKYEEKQKIKKRKLKNDT
ncbi:pescadillo-like [Anneissia japonica]|uniref:pescadillo-like n=1 Tax=Anneissia japonica TaxID=1529436 RepID=UPI001425A45C|nr:pescadillo-like [Anneissia japonica]